MLNSALCPWKHHAGWWCWILAPSCSCWILVLLDSVGSLGHTPCSADGVEDESPSVDYNSSWCLWGVSVMSGCCSLPGKTGLDTGDGPSK